MTKYIFDIETHSKDEDVMVDGKYKPTPCKEQIICICLYDIDNPENNITTLSGTNEYYILKSFFDKLKEGDSLIGFNSNAFDWQMILVRSIHHNIKVTKNLNLIDLRQIIYPYNTFTRGSLFDFTKLIGLQTLTENGSHMKTFFVNNEWDKINTHCSEDVVLSKALYDRMQSCNLI